MFLKAPFKGGLDLKFLPQCDFESISEGLEPSKQAPIIARNAVRFLMMGWTSSWTDFLIPTVGLAVLFKRDHELLKELRFAFQQGFRELFEQLKTKNNLSDEQKEQVQLYLSNCLSLLPYGDLTPYESITIPQYINEHWEMVEYQITPIELTEFSENNKIFLKDEDRVFAYGLQPLFQNNAESHLIFMGTTYPAGQGFLSQINADAKGFESVGKKLYRTGRARIQSWLEQQNSTHVCGVSLGGSLSLLLAIDKGSYKLSRVDALNPAGLHDPWSKSRFDHWAVLGSKKPHVVVQKQGDDPVSAFGIWKHDWDIIKVKPPKDKKGPNPFYDHFLNYAGFADTEFTYIEAKTDNEKRKGRNFWLYSLGRSVLYYGFLVPYTYIVRPFLQRIFEHWSLAIVFLGVAVTAGLALGGVLSGIGFIAISGSLLISAILLSNAAKNNQDSSFEYKETSLQKQERFERKSLAAMHDPSLSRNPTMDIYANETDINLTYRDINTYYHVMRCIVKNKDYLPESNELSKHVDGVSKRELLLEASFNSEKASVVVPFKVTKAKAAHIKHTLSLFHQLGEKNEGRLKEVLDQHYVQYRLGKGC